jgi:uncharacterized protein YkwD
MRTSRTWKALPLLLALTGCGSMVGSTPADATTLNGFRAANGLKGLRQDASLTAMASSHSHDMARRNSLDHNGFMQSRGPGGARAENVAFGCGDAACAIRVWSNSAGHRRNMLIPSLTRYGIASATSSKGRKYWTLMLGE